MVSMFHSLVHVLQMKCLLPDQRRFWDNLKCVILVLALVNRGANNILVATGAGVLSRDTADLSTISGFYVSVRVGDSLCAHIVCVHNCVSSLVLMVAVPLPPSLHCPW